MAGGWGVPAVWVGKGIRRGAAPLESNADSTLKPASSAVQGTVATTQILLGSEAGPMPLLPSIHH